MDPARGLYTAIIAGVLVSLFGGSRVQIAGPTGAFVVIIAGIVDQYGYSGLCIATIMARCELLDKIGEENLFGNIDDALSRAREIVGWPPVERPATAVAEVAREAGRLGTRGRGDTLEVLARRAPKCAPSPPPPGTTGLYHVVTRPRGFVTRTRGF